MKSILITGCNRGIGLGFVRCLVQEEIPPKNIIVTCRELEKAKDLQEIADSNKNVHILQLDVKNTEKFDEFAKEVEGIVREDGLNVLLNNAGYAPKSTRITMVKSEHMLETFRINAVGPLMLTKALLPLIKKAAKNNANITMGSGRAAVVNMTSSLGSISLNENGGVYPYRCSKVALNMASKSLSIDLKNDCILVTCIHPGWIRTGMGGSNAPTDIDTGASNMLEMIKNLAEEHNGGFYQWDGKQLGW